jgi:hypothetical protein
MGVQALAPVFPRIPRWFLALDPEPFPIIKRRDEQVSVVALIVPNDNSVRPASDAISRGEAKSVSRSRPCLSLANEIRRCRRVQVSTVRTLISKPRGEAARSLVDSGFSGSPSFVAVMQPTDLR